MFAFFHNQTPLQLQMHDIYQIRKFYWIWVWKYRGRFCNQYLLDSRSCLKANRLKERAENLRGTSYKTVSYVKSSSIFLPISFWFFLPSFRSFPLYLLIVIKARSRSLKTPHACQQLIIPNLYEFFVHTCRCSFVMSINT